MGFGCAGGAEEESEGDNTVRGCAGVMSNHAVTIAGLVMVVKRIWHFVKVCVALAIKR